MLYTEPSMKIMIKNNFNLNVQSENSHNYTVGDQDVFYILESYETAQYKEITATCKRICDEVYIFHQDGIEINHNYTQIGSSVDNLLMPFLKKSFAEPSDIDKNGKVVILFAELDRFIAGQFNPIDLTNDPSSYEGEIIHINYNMEGEYTLTSILHELQHLINKGIDFFEETWFDEGCSMLSEILLESELEENELITIVIPNDVSLTYWNRGNFHPNLDSYAITKGFLLYLWDQYGSSNFSAIYNAEDDGDVLSGIAGIIFILNYYFPSLTFERLYLNWLIASIVDKGYTGDIREYYYEHAEVSVNPTRFPSSSSYTSSSYPYNSTLTLFPWMTKIYKFRYFDPKDPINITIEIPLDSQDHLFGVNIVKEIELNDSFEYLIDSFMLTETNISASYHATFNAMEEGFSNLYITVSHIDGGEGFYEDIPDSEKDVQISLLVEATSTITATTTRTSRTAFDISLFYLMLLSFCVLIIQKRFRNK